MRTTWGALAAALTLAGLLTSGSGPQPGQGGLVLIGEDGRQADVGSGELAAIAPATVELPPRKDQTAPRSFSGGPLWALLVRNHLVDPGKPRAQASETVLVTGSDGYQAALAIGEISPAFEGKQVILADRLNGQPLGDAPLLVIPGDRVGARNVRAVVRIEVTTTGSKGNALCGVQGQRPCPSRH